MSQFVPCYVSSCLNKDLLAIPEIGHLLLLNILHLYKSTTCPLMEYGSIAAFMRWNPENISSTFSKSLIEQSLVDKHFHEVCDETRHSSISFPDDFPVWNVFEKSWDFLWSLGILLTVCKIKKSKILKILQGRND